MAYIRYPKTAQEARASYDEENLVRAKRRAKNLPDAWDDRPAHEERSWKRNKRCRKQWQKKKPG